MRSAGHRRVTFIQLESQRWCVHQRREESDYARCATVLGSEGKGSQGGDGARGKRERWYWWATCTCPPPRMVVPSLPRLRRGHVDMQQLHVGWSFSNNWASLIFSSSFCSIKTWWLSFYYRTKQVDSTHLFWPGATSVANKSSFCLMQLGNQFQSSV